MAKPDDLIPRCCAAFRRTGHNRSADAHLRSRGTDSARVLIGFALENGRAQGMPDARCTRGLVRNGEVDARTSIQAQRRHPASPA